MPIAFGYRFRVTLAFGLLSLVSVTGLTGLMLLSSYQEFRADRVRSVERMTECLAGYVYWDMQASDPSRVGESLARFARGVPAAHPPAVVVTDARGAPYATFEWRGPPGQRPGGQGSGTATTTESAAGFLTRAPVERDGRVLGSVLVDYPIQALRDHFFELFGLVLWCSLGLLLVLLLIAWVLGRTMVAPVTQLRTCMRRVAAGDLEVDCTGIRTRDEFGELARGFEEMVSGLREKRALEQEVLRSERLAAIGQVAAGVAHEINNPLGGLLNAVSTFKRHGSDPAVVRKTVDLLERGLVQIQHTVQALLVEARVESRRLLPEDLDDVRTLVDSEVARKGLRLEWECQLPPEVCVPSAPVRHVLMNLLLNAIRAAPPGGRVATRCEVVGNRLRIAVEDDGPGLPEDVRAHLFEPLRYSRGGHGLGLWVTYQTVGQLHGEIQVHECAPGTRFEIAVPVPADCPPG